MARKAIQREKRPSNQILHHLKQVGEEGAATGLVTLGVHASLKRALHNHLLENDHHYARSYNAYNKVAKNAVTRMKDNWEDHVRKTIGASPRIKKGAKAASGVAKKAGKVAGEAMKVASKIKE
jgi:hypothetical protein